MIVSVGSSGRNGYWAYEAIICLEYSKPSQELQLFLRAGFPAAGKERGLPAAGKIDGFVKSPISALRAISQNFTYDKYAAFFEIAQALILNFLQSRQIETFYECIKNYGINELLLPSDWQPTC